MGEIIDLKAAIEARHKAAPVHPILESLDALALALTEHDHVWTEREVLLYETAVAYFAPPPEPSE